MASRKRTPKPAKAAETPEQEPVAATTPAPEAETVSDTAPVTETAAGAPDPASEPGTAAAAPTEPETAAVAPEPAPEPETEAPAPAQGDEPEITPPESAGEEAVVAASPPATLETLVSNLKMVSEAVSNVSSKPVSEGGQAKIWSEIGEARDPIPVTVISDDMPLQYYEVTVVGPAKGFRRAGRAFGPEAVTFPAFDLTHEQLRALMNERELIVRVTLIAD